MCTPVNVKRAHKDYQIKRRLSNKKKTKVINTIRNIDPFYIIGQGTCFVKGTHNQSHGF